MAIDARELCPLIQVFDMPRALAFYRGVLGFESVDGSPDWQLLRLGGAWLMLNTAYEADERPPAPDPARVEAHRDTGLFITADDLDGISRLLTERGIAHTPPTTQAYGMRQLYVLDPDGYEICFQHPAEYKP